MTKIVRQLYDPFIRLVVAMMRRPVREWFVAISLAAILATACLEQDVLIVHISDTRALRIIRFKVSNKSAHVATDGSRSIRSNSTSSLCLKESCTTISEASPSVFVAPPANRTILTQSKPEHVGGQFSIHKDWHPRHRHERFPSVQERIKLYTSNWYHPPCETAEIGRLSEHITVTVGKQNNETRLKVHDPWNQGISTSVQLFGNQIEWNVPFLLTRRVMEGCLQTVEPSADRSQRASRSYRKINLPGYCLDALEIVDIMDQLDNNAQVSTPLLAMFGNETGLDAGDLFDLPFFHKHRAVATWKQIDKGTGDITPQGNSSCWMLPNQPLENQYYQEVYGNRLAPIIWKRAPRHWTPLKKAANMDTPWKKKKDLAFWRGIMTGSSQMGDTDVETCRSNQRCSFVLDYADSKLIDCGLTNHHELLSSGVVQGT